VHKGFKEVYAKDGVHIMSKKQAVSLFDESALKDDADTQDFSDLGNLFDVSASNGGKNDQDWIESDGSDDEFYTVKGS
jgi:hypothetical protein